MHQCNDFCAPSTTKLWHYHKISLESEVGSFPYPCCTNMVSGARLTLRRQAFCRLGSVAAQEETAEQQQHVSALGQVRFWGSCGCYERAHKCARLFQVWQPHGISRYGRSRDGRPWKGAQPQELSVSEPKEWQKARPSLSIYFGRGSAHG